MRNTRLTTFLVLLWSFTPPIIAPPLQIVCPQASSVVSLKATPQKSQNHHAITAPSLNTTATPSAVPPSQQGSIAIIVQSTLYSAIKPAVSQYREDISITGYRTILFVEPISTPEGLKDLLAEWYVSNHLVGAVLIGRLPYAEFHHPASDDFDAETFICDLFLMDLDGTWHDDSPKDGVYDDHDASGDADIYPEIFVGRIDPSCLSWGGGVTEHINTYLSRLHEYRTGGIQRLRRALVYVDDDWSGYWGSRWNNEIGLTFDNRTFVDTPITTRANDWTARLSEDYQWTHVCAHSSPVAHYFGPSGNGEGVVTSEVIRQTPPMFNFYSLFACSGAEWTTVDNLAVTYTFSGNYSLATIGSSKTGGMMDNHHFYTPLGENEGLGESIIQWYSSVLNTDGTAEDAYLEWYYGVNIVGDPLLTVRYDCTVLPPTVSSTTHPEQNGWYTSTRPQFNWTPPPDANEVAGYYYIIDQTPDTVPTRESSTHTDETTVLVEHDLSEGTWYLHVVAEDSIGNIGETPAHFQVNIDTTPPITKVSEPTESWNSSTDMVNVTWVSFDSLSGHSYSQVWLDDPLNMVYEGGALNTTLVGLTEGMHVINVTVFDAAGNTASWQVAIQVDVSNPVVTITSPLEGSTIGTGVVVTWKVDDVSGPHHTELWLDDTLCHTLSEATPTKALKGLAEGAHTLRVIVVDWANHSGAAEVSFEVFLLLDYAIPGTLLGLLAVTVVVIYALKRRRG